MKVMAFNGSPRKKKWNTVTMLENALEGARSAGAETGLIHLYDMQFSGCISCFSCKKLNRKEDGVCSVQDELAPVLKRIRETCEALIIGSPIYYGCETASTRAFLERLCYPYNRYAKDTRSLFPRHMKTAMIYTMNVTEESFGDLGYDRQFEKTRKMLETHFGSCEVLVASDTLQYSDYDLYESERFDEKAKMKRHVEVFPEDCQRAYDLGGRLAS